QAAQRGKEGQARDAHPVGPAAPLARLVHQRLANVEEDCFDMHEPMPFTAVLFNSVRFFRATRGKTAHKKISMYGAAATQALISFCVCRFFALAGEKTTYTKDKVPCCRSS